METPVHAPFKEKVRIEITKMREMDFKTRMGYIWEYYKYLIIGLVIVLIIIGSLINTWFINPPPQTALFISWNSGFAFQEQLDDLTDALTEKIVDEKQNETVIVSMSISSDDDPSVSMAMIQRTVAMLAAGELDIFILDYAALDEYSLSGFLQPLDDILAQIQSINPAVYDRIKDAVISASIEEEEGVTQERITGISLSNNPLLTRLDFFEQELYLGVSATSRRDENVINAIIAFFE